MTTFSKGIGAWQAAFFLGLMLFVSVPVQAAEETRWNRDADVDAVLADGGVSGQALPATGFQTPLASVQGLPVPGAFNPTGQAMKLPAADAAAQKASQSDSRAEVFGFTGKARVMKKGTEYWTPVYKGMWIEAGDKILTYEKSQVSLRYDRNFKNLIQVEEGTQAEFRSIEPTDIILQKGTLFHYLDALIHGKNYRVNTPVGSFGVRGTYWVSGFDGTSGVVGTLQDQNDKNSSIFCQFPNGKQKDPLFVPEGQQLNIDQGDLPTDGDLKELDPELQEQGDENLQRMSQMDPSFNELRQTQESNNILPPTSGDLGGVGNMDAGGEGVVGNNDVPLDPLLDTKSTNPEPPSSEEPPPPDSGDHGEGEGDGGEGDGGGGCQPDGEGCY